MKTRIDCEIGCDCVKRANVVLRVGLCEEIFARKHTATHKPTSAQPLSAPHSDLDDTHTHTYIHTYIHTRINRLWSPLAYGLGGNKLPWQTTVHVPILHFSSPHGVLSCFRADQFIVHSFIH